jgi:hypothetical protein
LGHPRWKGVGRPNGIREIWENGPTNHIFRSVTEMHPPMAATLIRAAAKVISPNQPIKLLMNIRGSPRSTAKSWHTGRRRPPIWCLEQLRDMMWVRGVTELVQQFDYVIRQRTGEPPRRTGFNEVRERDGPGSIPRDGRNRLGRPRRIRSL